MAKIWTLKSLFNQPTTGHVGYYKYKSVFTSSLA